MVKSKVNWRTIKNKKIRYNHIKCEANLKKKNLNPTWGKILFKLKSEVTFQVNWDKMRSKL